MRPPPPDTSTPQERMVEVFGGVDDFGELWESSALFGEHRRQMREKVRVYPEPIELAHLALRLKPELCAKGRSGWLEALQNARDYYDDAVEAAIVETNRDRSELRLKLQRQHAAELISQIEARGFLRFQPRGSGGRRISG